MENKDAITKILIFWALLLATPFFVFSYDDDTTHPALTQEIVKFYNLKFPKENISDADAEYIIQGSIDEDKDGRWTRHFYDPVHSRGLSYLGTQWQSAKTWAGDTLAQATFKIQDLPKRTLYGKLKDVFAGETDYSWERGIYEYAWGNKTRGLEALGHILHLIEDMSVPDHTRNDPHPALGKRLHLPFLNHHDITNTSPYESFAVFNRGSLDVVGELQEKNLVNLPSIDEYFESIAKYSNGNFFSEDTIFSNNYENPKEEFKKIEKVSSDVSLRFGYNKEGSRIVVYAPDFTWKEIEKGKKYTIDDPRILNDYFLHLSKQAVLHGSGVIALFFKEVEKERNDKVLYTKNRSWLGRRVDAFKNAMFGVAGALYGTSVTLKDVDEELPRVAQRPAAAQEKKQDSKPRDTATTEAKPPYKDEGTPTPQAPQEKNQEKKEEQEHYGGLASIVEVATSTTIAPVPVLVLTAAASSSPQDTFPSPPSSVATRNAEPAPAASLAPAVSLSVAECANSLSSDGCLAATTTLAIAWSSSASNLSHYIVECEVHGASCANFNFSNTTATSTTYVAEDSATTTFRARAVANDGQQSVQQSQTVEIATRTLVINEIAWAGTSSTRSADEWIELYNPTGKTVELSGWVLHSSTDQSPYIALSGSLASHAFFLLERTDDNTVRDIAANQTYTGPLNNTGEELRLAYASTTIDRAPAVSACGGWCFGDTSAYRTMERFDPSSSGADTANWGSFSGLLPNGTNADGASISGTPGRRNSINYKIANATLTQNTVVSRARSPYVGGLTVPSGVTLTIDPGVVIKLQSATDALTVNGSIMAGGTSAEPVIFTSFKDDAYGGDTNADGSAATPAPGDWASLKITSGAASSTISYAVIRYGGVEDAAGSYAANLRIENASTTVKNSTIEKSKTYGVYLKSVAGGTIADNIIRNNDRNVSGETPGVGVFSSASGAAITGNTFTANTKGLVIESGGTFAVANNTFTQNTVSSVEVSQSHPVFSGNTASGNGVNGITIQNTQSADYTFAADLPYVIASTYTVQSGRTLTVAPGAVVKFGSASVLSVLGILSAAGTASSPIIFTSQKDDTAGGDTNGDGSATSAAAGDWYYLVFNQNLATSTLTHAAVRYGGDANAGHTDHGGIRITSSSPEIRNSTIEYNYAMGIFMSHATSTVIADSAIRNHADSTSETWYGLYLTASSTPTVSNTTYTNNETNVFADGTSAVQ